MQGRGERWIDASCRRGTGLPAQLDGAPVRGELLGPERRLGIVHREVTVAACYQRPDTGRTDFPACPACPLPRRVPARDPT
jgi:hypothetical protein